MKRIAAIILQNPDGDFLFYRRDNKPGIPFPDYWDLIGGHVEDWETPEMALYREFREELGLELTDFKFFKEFLCVEGDAYPNIKYIYSGIINVPLERITLLEGNYPGYFSAEEIPGVRLANILKEIVLEYIDFSN